MSAGLSILGHKQGGVLFDSLHTSTTYTREFVFLKFDYGKCSIQMFLDLATEYLRVETKSLEKSIERSFKDQCVRFGSL